MASVKQDMPPSGGYKPISFGRIPAKTYFSGYTWFLGFAAFNGACVAYYVMYELPRIRRTEIEIRSARNAILPLLMAEHDRAFLKQIKQNRDEEAKLMKDVKNWEVGTLHGEPIYKTLPEGSWVTPKAGEFYVHNNPKDRMEREYYNLSIN